MSSNEVRRNKAPAKGSDRTFGIVFAALFAVIAGWPLMDGGAVRVWSVVVASVFAVTAVLFPKVLAPLNRTWMKFGDVLHRVTNPIILGAVYFAVFTPVAICMRAFGKDPLRLKRRHDAATYWISREPPGPAPESMSEQF
jgi:hypothetical protein